MWRCILDEASTNLWRYSSLITMNIFISHPQLKKKNKTLEWCCCWGSLPNWCFMARQKKKTKRPEKKNKPKRASCVRSCTARFFIKTWIQGRHRNKPQCFVMRCLIEPNWAPIWIYWKEKKQPPKQGRNSNQNKRSFGFEVYIIVYVYTYLYI